MTNETSSAENTADISDSRMEGGPMDTAGATDRLPTPEAAPSTMAENPGPRPPDLVKRIGGTTYEVSFHFSGKTDQTFESRIMRLIRRELRDL